MDERKLHLSRKPTPVVVVLFGWVLFCILFAGGVAAYWSGVLP